VPFKAVKLYYMQYVMYLVQWNLVGFGNKVLFYHLVEMHLYSFLGTDNTSQF